MFKTFLFIKSEILGVPVISLPLRLPVMLMLNLALAILSCSLCYGDTTQVEKPPMKKDPFGLKPLTLKDFERAMVPEIMKSNHKIQFPAMGDLSEFLKSASKDNLDAGHEYNEAHDHEGPGYDDDDMPDQEEEGPEFEPDFETDPGFDDSASTFEQYPPDENEQIDKPESLQQTVEEPQTVFKGEATFGDLPEDEDFRAEQYPKFGIQHFVRTPQGSIPIKPNKDDIARGMVEPAVGLLTSRKRKEDHQEEQPNSHYEETPPRFVGLGFSKEISKSDQIPTTGGIGTYGFNPKHAPTMQYGQADEGPEPDFEHEEFYPNQDHEVTYTTQGHQQSENYREPDLYSPPVTPAPTRYYDDRPSTRYQTYTPKFTPGPPPSHDSVDSGRAYTTYPTSGPQFPNSREDSLRDTGSFHEERRDGPIRNDGAFYNQPYRPVPRPRPGPSVGSSRGSSRGPSYEQNRGPSHGQSRGPSHGQSRGPSYGPRPGPGPARPQTRFPRPPPTRPPQFDTRGPPPSYLNQQRPRTGNNRPSARRPNFERPYNTPRPQYHNENSNRPSYDRQSYRGGPPPRQYEPDRYDDNRYDDDYRGPPPTHDQEAPRDGPPRKKSLEDFNRKVEEKVEALINDQFANDPVDVIDPEDGRSDRIDVAQLDFPQISRYNDYDRRGPGPGNNYYPIIIQMPPPQTISDPFPPPSYPAPPAILSHAPPPPTFEQPPTFVLGSPRGFQFDIGQRQPLFGQGRQDSRSTYRGQPSKQSSFSYEREGGSSGSLAPPSRKVYVSSSNRSNAQQQPRRTRRPDQRFQGFQ